jgi:hypothetical protein
MKASETWNTVRSSLLLVATALLLRLVLAAWSPGSDDVTNFIHTARLVQAGYNVYQYQPAYPYPPLYAWILVWTLTLTDAVGIPENLAVRLPAIFADSVITLLVFLIARRHYRKGAKYFGWLYALNPITVMIASHQGHFDSLAYLPAIAGVWLYEASGALSITAILLGLGGALKITPTFLALAWVVGMRNLKQIILFSSLVVLPTAVVLYWGWQSAPGPFVTNVLGYKPLATTPWGYNFIMLLAERLSRPLHWEFISTIALMLRAGYKYILLFLISIASLMTRNKIFIERVFLVQISVQLFAGTWDPQYTAWIVPLAVLSNQRGMLLWGGLTIIWMILIYLGFVMTGALQDNIFRAATTVGFLSWVALGFWYCANLIKSDRRVFHWFTSPLVKQSN